MISISLVYSAEPRMVQEMEFSVAVGSTLGQALQSSGVVADWNLGEIDAGDVGVWGRKAALTQVLRANDRIEIYRALTVDPKVARRERFVRQGARSTGLFAKQRAGAKSGY